MSRHDDRQIGDQWFSTVWLDVAESDERVHLASDERGLTIDMPDVPLDLKAVRELRLTLARYELWAGAR